MSRVMDRIRRVAVGSGRVLADCQWNLYVTPPTSGGHIHNRCRGQSCDLRRQNAIGRSVGRWRMKQRCMATIRVARPTNSFLSAAGSSALCVYGNALRNARTDISVNRLCRTSVKLLLRETKELTPGCCIITLVSTILTLLLHASAKELEHFVLGCASRIPRVCLPFFVHVFSWQGVCTHPAHLVCLRHWLKSPN